MTLDQWPDDKLEQQMIADAGSVGTDVGCHVRALLSRVRELEAEVERLRRYERAMQSMADQICSPKTTAEEMVGQILADGETKKGARR